MAPLTAENLHLIKYFRPERVEIETLDKWCKKISVKKTNISC